MITENLYLKSYLQNLGVNKVKKLSHILNVHFCSLYNLAAGRANASPELAIKIHKATNGAVKYWEILGDKTELTFPKDMFTYHEGWKSKTKINKE